MTKSYWMGACVDTDSDREAVKSWFAPLCDDSMRPYKAEILCDTETDQEKKIRAFMTDSDGKRFRFERTRGKNFSIKKTPI